MAVFLASFIGSGFVKNTSAFIEDYTVSPDGSGITLRVGVASSKGYIRDVSVHQQEGGKLYLNCFSAFGGMNGRIGAKDTFTFKLDEDTSMIALYRNENCYEGVLFRRDDGSWQRGSQEADTASEKNDMKGTVMEIADGTMLIEPLEGSWELNSCDRFAIPIEHMNSSHEPEVGDIIEITCDGGIEETYPARLGGITHIELIGAAVGGDTCPRVTINGIEYFDCGNNPPKAGLPPAYFSIYEEEITVEGAFSGTATAYAVCDNEPHLLIDGEWYRFVATDEVGQP